MTVKKMKPEVKKKWVEALRSGEFAQGHYALNTEDGYCCLGVLSELAVRDGACEKWEVMEGTDVVAVYYGKKRGSHSSGFLASSVMRWAGLDNSDPSFDADELNRAHLSSLNDTGKTFVEIADVIEQHF